MDESILNRDDAAAEKSIVLSTSESTPTTTARGRLGGICAILIGVLNVLLLIYVVATPAGQRYDTGEFFTYYVESPVALSLAWVMLAMTSILAFAVIPAVADLVRSENEELTRLVSIIAIVAFAIMAVNFLTLIGKVPGLAQAYVAGDSSTRAAMLAIGLPELDPNGWLMFGGIGTWTLVVSILGWRSGKMSRIHAAIGIPTSICYWLTVIADVTVIETLNLIAAGGGAILAPIWYIWMGLRLIKPAADS